MPGGHARSTAPRDLARDPERWPYAVIADDAARVVQHIARALEQELSRRRLSVRGVEAVTGASRMAVTPLVNGDSWPDVLTVVRLERGLGCPLWPGMGEIASVHAKPFARESGNGHGEIGSAHP